MDAERLLSHLSELSKSGSSARTGARSERPDFPNAGTRAPRTASLLGWILIAAGLCWLSWPAPAQAQPACAHGICEVGGDLNPNCDPCVDAICNEDPYCCTVEWDDNCIDQVLPICFDPSCAAACSHSPCTAGDPLDSTCNSCVEDICAADPVCCSATWDANCIAMVDTVCGAHCEPGENICSNATPITPGVYFGTLLGASNDGCESGQNSCRAADVWYSYTAVVGEDMFLNTCETQRSFGIDSVLSVHTGCPGKQNNEIVSNDDHFLGLLPLACATYPPDVNLDAAVPLAGANAVGPGETVIIRIAHHNESTRNDFVFRLLPEPSGWSMLIAGVGALGALARRRARG